jgi:hypothetical protein
MAPVTDVARIKIITSRATYITLPVIIWFRTRLDREMYDNALCCTYPEECSGQHSPDISLPRSEATVLWKILQVSEVRYGIL